MRTRAWSQHMPGLLRIQVVDRIKMVDNTKLTRKELEMQKSELPWSLSGTHPLDCHVTAAYSSPLT